MLKPLALALAFAATPALAFDIDAMSEDERQAFRAEIRAYLLDNPEVLMEAIGVVDTHLLGAHRRGVSGLWEADGTRR